MGWKSEVLQRNKQLFLVLGTSGPYLFTEAELQF